MDGPDWEDDDLIDDYINDEEPQPEDYMHPDEEEYYRAAPPPETEHPAPEPVSTNEVKNVDMLDAPVASHNKIENSQVEDTDDSSPLTGITIDLYSFERYSEYNWRTVKTLNGEVSVEKSFVKSDHEEPIDEDFREVLKRSRINENIGSSSINKVAPEGKLLRFSSGGGRRGSCCSWKQIASGKYSNHSNILSTRSSITDSSRPLTLLNGTRVFATKRKTDITKSLNGGQSSKSSSLHMLELPLNVLERKAEEIERKMLTKRFTETSTNNSNADAGRSSRYGTAEDSHLWVDKYAPTKFSHLLSDEYTNREVLRTLRAWDPYVFKTRAPVRPTYIQHKQEEKARNGVLNKKENNSTKDNRPELSERVILLCGPPGIGKSTLAHIAAKHAGYRPIEVNASDERSTSALKERVVNAMESKTLSGISSNDELQGRPNCIILDEVDGADTKTAISTLVEIICAEIPERKSSKPKPYLRRPIIFICNHKYAPALRPLLPHAKIFDIHPPTSSRLVARLKTVLNSESFTCQSSILSQLADGSGGDIRSCLYTLQFSAARLRKSRNSSERFVDITHALASVLSGRDQGVKDQRSDTASVLYTVFKKAKANPFRKVTNLVRDTERVIGVIAAFDDGSRTLDSLFTNILGVSYSDPTLDRCAEAHEWLSCGDLYRSHRSPAALHDFGQVDSLQRQIVPLVAAVLHFFCRVETKPNLIFTLKDISNSWFQQEANSVLLSKFLDGLSPAVKCNITYLNSVQDTIPFILWLLSAGNGEFSLVRPVSSIELLKPSELSTFQNHVRLLRSLGLTYIRAESIGSNRTMPEKMILEPAIDGFVRFNDLTVNGKGEIPCTVKELLAHCATLESMKHLDNSSFTNTEDQSPSVSNTSLQSGRTTVDTQSSSIVPNKSARNLDETSFLSPTAPKRQKISKAKSFLGEGAAKAKAARTARRAALVKSNQSSKKTGVSNSGSGIPLNQVIRFKYQKGFTQAVRVPCSLDDFL